MLSDIFRNSLTKKSAKEEINVFNYIPGLIINDDKDLLSGFHIKDEIKEVVVDMSFKSSLSPNGFNGLFIRNAGVLLIMVLLILLRVFGEAINSVNTIFTLF